MVCDSKQNRNNWFCALSSIDSAKMEVHSYPNCQCLRVYWIFFSISSKVAGKKSIMDWSSRFCEPQAISKNRVTRITYVDNIDGEMICKWKQASNTNKHFIFPVLFSIFILVVHCCQLQLELHSSCFSGNTPYHFFILMFWKQTWVLQRNITCLEHKNTSI
jgi:hypothetical protein